MPEPPDTWTEIQDQLRDAVTDSTYHLWLAPLTFEGIDEDVVLVAAPDEIRSWVSERFSRVLQACVAAVLGPETTVAIISPPATRRAGGSPPATGGGATTGTGAARANRRGGAGERDGASPGESGGSAARRNASPRSRGNGHGAEPAPEAATSFNPKYTFEQFVIGEGNRMAHAAALAVAELPGSAYNPLFIYGPPGNGKTHLLHAIANYLRSFGGGLEVEYATAEAFTNRFIDALRGSGMESFKNRYRHNDVLLIDDIQFFEKKERIEEEFFHTFNALYETGSQLVLTSDRPPRDLEALADRLRERFESGLVTDIAPPNIATRLTILRKRVQYDRLPPIDEGALRAIAGRITTNIRALEGALIRVVAFHSLTHRPLNAELAEEVLAGLYPETRSARRTVYDVQQATCEAFNLSMEELVSSTRTARVAWPRQVAMYLARELTDATLPAIGREFGGRNHTTVLHAHRRTTERISSDPEAFEMVDHITRRLRGA